MASAKRTLPNVSFRQCRPFASAGREPPACSQIVRKPPPTARICETESSPLQLLVRGGEHSVHVLQPPRHVREARACKPVVRLPQLSISPPAHSFRPRRKWFQHVRGAAQPYSDVLRTSSSSIARVLSLALVGQPAAVAAYEYGATVKDRNSAPTFRTEEPRALSAVVTHRPVQPYAKFFPRPAGFAAQVRVRQASAVSFQVYTKCRAQLCAPSPVPANGPPWRKEALPAPFADVDTPIVRSTRSPPVT